MKRRSFFQCLALAAGAIAAPALFLPKEPVKWKRTRQIWVLNPEYQTAKYEIYIVAAPALFDEAILEEDAKHPILADRTSERYIVDHTSCGRAIPDPFPPRFCVENGVFRRVHPFMAV